MRLKITYRFRIGVPKVDGQSDYHWNRTGQENVMAVLTSNVEVSYVSGGVVNHMETQAWQERFKTFRFRMPLPNPDKRFKEWRKRET